MNEKKYGWRFPLPKGKFNWKDILIFHTYACALALWPWIIHAIIFPINGGPQGFMMILCLPLAILITFIYSLIVASRSRKMSRGWKIALIVLAFFIVASIFILPLMSHVMLSGSVIGYYLSIAAYILITPLGLLLAVMTFPSLFMGLGFMFVLPLLGIYRKKNEVSA